MSLSDLAVSCASGRRRAALVPREGSSTKRTRIAKWARGLVLLTALLAPSRALAEQPLDENHQTKQRAAQSEQLAVQGFTAYQAGEYERAIQFYNQALEAHPAAALYFNIARIYDTKLAAPDKALEYYRKTLEAPEVTEALAEKSLARIRVLSATLEQTKPAEGKAKSPEPVTTTEPEPTPADRPSQAAVEDQGTTSKRSTQKTIGYVVGITGLVAAGAGLGLGGWALVERDQARESCDGNQCTTQDGVDSMSTAYDLATAATVALAAGGALAAVGFGMVLFAPSNPAAEQHSMTASPRARRTGAKLAILPTFGGGALQLTGAFH